ncbi:MAG TPA: glycosyltransferase [Roseimicrobium sp.]|nr:glycosyltransferase [Roseimicrobium sp.]
MTQSVPSILLLIPAYNEEKRIEPVLREYAAYFRTNHPGRFELVVVLNGCRDNTLQVVQKVGVEFSEVRSLEFAAPIGKGGALIEGLKLAPTADLIGYVDADGATPPAAFYDLVQKVANADCAVGSRWIPGAVLHQSQSGKRQFASRVFHLIVQSLFWMNIRDTQCGAKVMHRAAVERIHGSLRIADMAFDINLLYCLKREGFKILEIPTEWTDKVGSKVAFGKTSLTMLLSVIRLRWVYSPFYSWLKPLRPLELWVYNRLLRAPAPLPSRSATPASASEKSLKPGS